MMSFPCFLQTSIILFSVSLLSGFAGKTENHRMLGLF